MLRVAVIDCGSGNLRSVGKALEKVGGRACTVRICTDPASLRRADRIVFPGQGAIGPCLAGLAERGLDVALLESARRGVPCLGICIGLHALLEYSEEDGGSKGLGLLPGRVRRLPHGTRDDNGRPRKVPHMGWNQACFTRSHPLHKGLEANSYFYFVHSYYADPDAAHATAYTDYGLRFCSALAVGSCYATQFHPEKSRPAGLRLLLNFLRWDGS